jgi:hypothetical protein
MYFIQELFKACLLLIKFLIIILFVLKSFIIPYA